MSLTCNASFPSQHELTNSYSCQWDYIIVVDVH